MLAALALLAGIGGLSYVIGSQISNLAGDRPQFQDRLHKSQNDIIGWIRSSFHIPRHKQETFMAVRPIKWRPRAVLGGYYAVVAVLAPTLSGLYLLYILSSSCFTASSCHS
jgi:hypothetical protein